MNNRLSPRRPRIRRGRLRHISAPVDELLLELYCRPHNNHGRRAQRPDARVTVEGTDRHGKA